MVYSILSMFFQFMNRFYTFLDSFVLFGVVSYLDLIVVLFVVWLIVGNFIPRG